MPLKKFWEILEEAARSWESAVDMVAARIPARIRPAASAGKIPDCPSLWAMLMKMVSDKGVKKVSGGMQMLVWQAAVAHTIWSGAEYTAEQVQAISDEMMRLV